jgi:hypothetical protein
MQLVTLLRSKRSAQHFLDKGNILISKDANYTQPLQQRPTLMAVRMHTTKKE